MRSRRPFRVWLGTIGPYLHISWHNEMTLSSSYPSTVNETEIPQPRHHSAELAALSPLSNSNWVEAGCDYFHLLFALPSQWIFFPPSLTCYQNQDSRQMLPGIYPLNTNLRNWKTNSNEEL